ncbi:MAG: hypothetical protein CBC48_09815 [bacterium TMED88]|nr:DUF1330 domain-containing protein [Deltaproteobacteria bacterium]OUV31288.1 MAG: hypothetical protein CBC48_09815 [bacterium TMED88]
MNVENQVQPDPEQIALFVKTEGPVCMVNLLKFKERAEYADGRTTDLTGYEAYSLYATQMRKLVEASGGTFHFTAACVGMLLGKVDEEWDWVGIVEYPSTRAMLEIASSEAFQSIEVHRVAGLKGQLNITTQQSDL